MTDLQNALCNGAEDYAPATMWFTSGNINRQEMTYQLEGFQKQGIRDFFIHPATGTQGDYLGDYFFRMIRHAVEEAKRLDMRFWVYDEYNWPSGVAAGQVLKEAPWACTSCLTRIVQAVASGETVQVELPDQEAFNTHVLLCATDGQSLPLTPDNNQILWTNTSGSDKTLEIYLTRWVRCKLDCLTGSEAVEPDVTGYLDTLDPDAVKVFIQKTHEVYHAQIGSDFGSSVQGIFTDEVPVCPYARMEKYPRFPWTRHLPQKFMERNGYDLLPRIKDLMDHADEKLTVDYWETVTDLFMSAYMDQIWQWCQAHDLIFTGHLLGEENIDVAVTWCADPYEYYKRFDRPGVDSILTYYFIDDYNFNIAAKRGSSAARFAGKKRLLCETFTVSGWEIRLRDMKRIIHRLALLGVNFLQYMGARYDFMPAYDAVSMTNNWQNPLFCHYGELSKYVSGLQWMVTNSVYEGSVLLLYPMTAARVQLPTPPEENWGSVLNDTLNGLVNSLLNLQVGFEFVFEQLIDEAEIIEGAFSIADGRFDTVILPCTLYLKEKTFRKLQEFAKSGGRIIAVNGKPEKVIGDAVYDAPVLENAVCYDCLEFETVGSGGQGNSGKRTPMGRFTQALQTALGEQTRGIVRITPQDGILSAVRKSPTGYYVMIINDADTEKTVTGQMLTNLPFRALDPETGADKPMHACGGQFSACLEPYGCIILEVSSSVLPNPTSVCPQKHRAALPLRQTAFSPEGANTAMPDLHLVRGSAADAILTARNAFNPKRVCDLANALTEQDLVLCRGSGNRFVPDISKQDWFGWTPVDGIKPGRGETVVCIYDFTVDSLPEQLELVSDPQWNTVWYLNGEQLYQSETRRVWHYANPVFDLRGVAQSGKNRLVAICTFPDYDRTFPLPCAVLKGSFRFFNDHILTQKPGGNALHYWNKQGYLCHTGQAKYCAVFTAPEHGETILELVSTDVVEVLVNGVSAGKRLWNPYRWELTSYLHPGENQLQILVTGTLSNFLYTETDSGITQVQLYKLSD